LRQTKSGAVAKNSYDSGEESSASSTGEKRSPRMDEEVSISGNNKD